MPTLLHLDSSMRIEGSRSRALSAHFADSWLQAHPGGTVIYGPGTPREGWDHREPWLGRAFSQLGIDDVRVIHTELTLARENPRMSGLEDLEDQSIADAHAAIDAVFAERALAA